jgi:NAD(P)H dehydrogenase (quinone)
MIRSSLQENKNSNYTPLLT